MIEAVYAYLAADSTLLTLLGGSAGDPRIYPELSPQDSVPPFLVYRVQRSGSPDEILDDMTIDFSIYTSTFAAGDAISDQLKILLDKKDQVVIPATNEFIYYSKHIGGDSLFEDADGTRIYHRVLSFALKFRRK